MANKKIRMKPEGANDYADVLHPETTASQVIEEANKKFMTDAERDKLAATRVITSGTAEPSGGSNGDIYFKRKV